MAADPLGWALLILRLGSAAVFLAHGWPKMTGAATAKTAEAFARNTIPYPYAAAWLAGAAQVLGGTLLVLGLATRPAGLLLAATMLVAVVKVKWRQGFVNAADFPLIMLFVAAALAVAGAGPLSLDAYLAR